jgi:2-polyprenyl-3-methyl-5-hydroxy-6-metoxy-1,4-benzoquinol methylase|tara:strand:- start:240 stop:1055 length:816 start_codon:yes stop_codon:yes gene_type:complete
MESLTEIICNLKYDFRDLYKGNSHTTEVLPNSPSKFHIKDEHLLSLYAFLENNPIYSNQIVQKLSDIDCTIFEGDLNNYWIDSLKHDSSYAPFYPTWLLSAFCLSVESQKLGYEQIIDIGSGDGRIAYSGKILGLNSISIEIDENLVDLQEKISDKTGVRFNPICSDATTYDFSKISDKPSIFIIGGVPEIGEVLAESVIKNVLKIERLSKSAFVLTGSHSHRKFSRDTTDFGWGPTIKKLGLSIISTHSLPTYWTMDQKFETPYVFVKKG